jgi:MFS family permease
MTSLLVCRFLAGLLSSAVFSNFGGTLADLFTPNERSSWVALFSLMLQGAPTIGPVPGNLMGEHVHWRWVLALIAIWGAVCTVPTLILPETEGKAIRRKVHKGSPLAQKGPGLKEVFSRALLTPVSE